MTKFNHERTPIIIFILLLAIAAFVVIAIWTVSIWSLQAILSLIVIILTVKLVDSVVE